MASQEGASRVKRAPTGKEIEEAIQRASLAEVVASSGRAARASKPVTAMELSDRLVTLRDQLEQSSAYADWKHLEEMRVLGGGASATVTKCWYRPPGARGQIVAVKQMKTELLGDAREVKAFVAEARLLKRLQHRYILGFYGCGWWKATEDSESVHRGRLPDPLPTHQQLFIMQEVMNGGSLQGMVFKAMTTQGCQVYADRDVLRWALQMAMALDYLHTQDPKVMHRDMKLENVLLTSNRASTATAKLADFGLARRMHGSGKAGRAKRERLERLISTKPEDLEPAIRSLSGDIEQRLEAWMALPNLAERSYHAQEMTAAAGSLGYMAPEVLRGEPYNEKADVFSYGVVLYNLFHRNIPTVHIMLNGSMADLEVYAHKVAHGFRQEIKASVPAGVRSIIERCWHPRPELRPSMGDVVAELQSMQPPLPPDEESDEPLPAECCTIM